MGSVPDRHTVASWIRGADVAALHGLDDVQTAFLYAGMATV